MVEFLVGVAVGLAGGFVIFRLYWVKEIAAGRLALARAQGFIGDVGKRL